jgi:hypothetical protein
MTSTMRFDKWENSLGQPYGTVLQVVSTTKTDTFSTNSTSLTSITGLSATITPKSTSSKILAILSLGQVDAAAASSVMGDITRAGTPIGIGDAAGNRTRSGWSIIPANSTRAHSVSWSFLDSPSTTSAITYQARMRTDGTLAFVNRTSADTNDDYYGRSISTITLTEIAQ